MKRIDELGISPMPWVYSKDIGAILSDAHGVVYDEQMLANDARLIAAAPDMYQVIIEAIPWLADISAEVVGNKCARQIDDLVKRMQVALAKASGENVK